MHGGAPAGHGGFDFKTFIITGRRTMEKLLTVKELSEYLRLTEVTIWKYAQAGKLPGFKIGRCWRFYKSTIDAALKCSDSSVLLDRVI